MPPDKDVIPLCTCKISGASFQKVASAVTYCQSLDSVDGKVCWKYRKTSVDEQLIHIKYWFKVN